MRATRFEFEQRFWIIGAIFGVGFWMYSFDQTNAAVGILRVLAPSVNPDSDAGNDRCGSSSPSGHCSSIA